MSLNIEDFKIELPAISSGDKGKLSFCESKNHIPFDIKRVYYIYDIDDLDTIRGKHAHKELKQVIFCLSGSFTLKLDNGKDNIEIELNKPNEGILIKNNLWRVMKSFEKNTVIMVLASDFYDESDYIRDYDEYLKYVNNEEDSNG